MIVPLAIRRLDHAPHHPGHATTPRKHLASRDLRPYTGAVAGASLSTESRIRRRGGGYAQEGTRPGGNFGGLTAALSVKHELQGDVDVTVVSSSDRFLFNPSLIWLPFGKRRHDDITFPQEPTFESHQVDFLHATATRIDPAARTVDTNRGAYP